MKDLKFIYENKEFVTKGENFNKEFNEFSIDEIKYNELKKRKESPWNKWFKDDLIKFTDDTCPICERIIDRTNPVDHFRPRKLYWWLTFNYKNYIPLCTLCNSSIYKHANFPLYINNKIVKGTKVSLKNKKAIIEEKPLLFNPTTDNPLELFKIVFLSKAKKFTIEPLNKKDEYLFLKAKTTISTFNLNGDIKIKRDRSRNILILRIYNNIVELAKSKIKYDKSKEIYNLIPIHRNRNIFENNKKVFLQQIERVEELKYGLTSLILNNNFIIL